LNKRQIWLKELNSIIHLSFAIVQVKVIVICTSRQQL
jgi:hypothetical protein